MEVEQVKHAEKPDEMRAEINRMARHDALTWKIMTMADLQGMCGEDRYTMLAYFALKERQEVMQRSIDEVFDAARRGAETKP